MTAEDRTREQLLEELKATVRQVGELDGQLLAAEAEPVVFSGKPPAEVEMGPLLEAVRSSVVVHDDKGKIIWSNSTAERLLAPRDASIIDLPVDHGSYAFLGEDGTELAPNEYPVSVVLETGRSVEGMILGVTPPGFAGPLWLLVHAVPFFMGEDRRPLVVVTSSDITELRRAEGELKESRNRLRNLTVRLDEVREEERTALARELHDDVGQALTAMRMDLAMVEEEVPEGQEQLADRLHSMLDLAQDSVDRVNRMSHDLRSPVLDILGLGAAVESEALEYQERWETETDLELEVEELEALPARDLTALRVLQAALSNVRRHADASRVEISMRVVGEELVLEVLDDGIGITDEQLKDPGSFGLVGMRERVERLGGALEIERCPEGGTRVRAKVPIASENR